MTFTIKYKMHSFNPDKLKRSRYIAYKIPIYKLTTLHSYYYATSNITCKKLNRNNTFSTHCQFIWVFSLELFRCNCENLPCACNARLITTHLNTLQNNAFSDTPYSKHIPKSLPISQKLLRHYQACLYLF